MSRSPFEPLAAVYAAGRPTYPDGIYDALDAAVPLAGAVVADVGAGTGISARGMLARGARVVAFDLAPAMLDQLRGNHSGALLGTVVGDGHALPLRGESVDLVTYAQAFHWMDPAVAGPEARRVLRPGGALAVWWNNSESRDEAWWLTQQEMLEVANHSYGRDYRVHDVADDLRLAFDGVTATEVPWARELDIETYLTYLSSKSYVAALGDRLAAFLDGQRAVLADAFPGGVVRERFVTRLWVAR